MSKFSVFPADLAGELHVSEHELLVWAWVHFDDEEMDDSGCFTPEAAEIVRNAWTKELES